MPRGKNKNKPKPRHTAKKHQNIKDKQKMLKAISEK